MSQTNTNTNNSQSGTKTPKEVDGAKEAPAMVAAAIAVMIAETR